MINQILIGDVLEKLKEIPDQFVNTVVTSPPYWGLRDYGTAQWKGGNAECDHKETAARNDGMRENINGFHGSSKKDSDKGSMNYRHICKGCGAIRIDDQIGLEKTPEEYVEKMVVVFREVRRVLRDDGTVWINLGDSYAQKGGRQVSDEEYEKKRERAELTGCNVGGWGASKKRGQGASGRAANTAVNGLKPKDLVGIPWMVAFALRADGWYLRQDIIWHKSNPMPESVTDRCTKAHEYIFLLSKSRKYYYDNESIKEAVTGNAHPRGDGINPKAKAAWKTPDGWDTSKGNGGHGSFHKEGREKGYIGYKVKQNPSFSAACNKLVDSRNKRSVWTVSTKPFPGAHFATFPPDLIEPCILAGSPRGGIILDPFFGSGTVGLVALKNARHYIGIELNPAYAEMAGNRIEYGTVDEEKVIEEKKQGTLFDDR